MINKNGYSAFALLFLICALYMGFGSHYSAQQLQPSNPIISEFPGTLITAPYDVLRFMAADSLFILCYLVFFIAIYLEIKQRCQSMATIALIMGVAAAIFDLMENSYLITYAQSTIAQKDIALLNIHLLYIVAAMKWATIYIAFFLYFLLWPRDSSFNKLIALLMLISPLLGITSIAFPELLIYRPYPFIVTFLFLARYLYQKPSST